MSTIRNDAATPSSTRASLPLLDRLGFPRGLGWGLVAVVVFLIGDGIETTWISNFLAQDVGIPLANGALIITAYGVVVAIAAFLSGTLADSIGPKRVMLIGVISFIVFDFLFIAVAIPTGNFALLLVIYALRGLGYPLFAYGFLTWIIYKAEPAKKSSAAGWFWFSFSLGLQVLGSYVASFFLPVVGEVNTLWIGLVVATIGGIGGLLLIREKFVPAAAAGVWKTVLAGLSISWRVPGVGIGGIVKVINIAGVSAFGVFYVPYLIETTGIAVSSAVQVFAVLGIFAVLGGLGWGLVGDRLGWRNTVQWFAPTFCIAAVLYLFYIPQLVGPNFALIAIGGALFGTGLSAFVPITALMSGLAPNETGAALSIVNLGSGLATFVGPGIVAVTLTATGVQGVVWVIAALYAVAFFLMFLMNLPGKARTSADVPHDIAFQAHPDAIV